MGTLVVRVGNALRQSLPDRMDVKLVSARTNALVQVASNIPGDAEVRFENLIDHQPYIVKVFPLRHRPVSQFGIPMPGAPVVVQLYAPLDPERVSAAKFPRYEEIAPTLRAVLDCSTVEGVTGCGPPLYS